MSIDHSESGSLTPEIKRKAKAIKGPPTLTEKQYEYGYKDQEPIVKRFAISPQDIPTTEIKGGQKQMIEITKQDLHSVEQSIFNLALKELNTKNVVLVDIFAREVPSKTLKHPIVIDKKTGYPETHTICLWKGQSNKITAIDPSNSDLSKFIANIDIYKGVIEIHEHNQRKFYFEPSKTVFVGTEKYDKRDCIDIAVKIAFQIIEATNAGNNDAQIKEKINLLSNQSKVNSSLGDANNTILRELQSSDSTKREKVIELFKEILNKVIVESNNKKRNNYTEKIIINTLEDLEDLKTKVNEQSFVDTFNKIINNSPRITKFILSKVEEISKFIDETNQRLATLGLQYYNIEIVKNQDPNIEASKEELFNAIEAKDFGRFNAALGSLTPDKLTSVVSSVDEYGQTFLHWAADNGCFDIAKVLTSPNIMKDEDIAKEAGHQNYTALHLANHSNSKEIVNLLLKRIPELVNAIDIYGQTALHHAAADGHEEIAEMLLQEMKDDIIVAKPGGSQNYTALHLANHSNSKEIVNLLLKRVPELVNAIDIYGQTALHHAAADGHEEIAEMLLQKMKDNNIIATPADSQKYTALHLATQSNSQKIVKLLLERVPGLVNALDIYGQTALHWAASKGHVEIAEMLLQKMKDDIVAKPGGSQNYTALHLAVQSGSDAIVQMLLDNNNSALLGLQDKAGFTATHRAIMVLNNNSIKLDDHIIYQLIEQLSSDALIMTENTHQYTVLHSAVQSRNNIIVQKLLSKKDIPNNFVNLQDDWGKTALHWAASIGNADICSLLLDEVSDNNLLNQLLGTQANEFNKSTKIAEANKEVINKANTALHCATGNLDVFKLLLSHMQITDVIKKGDGGNTVLHAAVISGNDDIVKLLLEQDYAKTLTQITNDAGNTALDLIKLAPEDEFGQAQGYPFLRISEDIKKLLKTITEDISENQEESGMYEHNGLGEGINVDIDATTLELLDQNAGPFTTNLNDATVNLRQLATQSLLGDGVLDNSE